MTPEAKAKLSAVLMIVGSVAWLVGGIFAWPSSRKQLGRPR